MPRYTLDLRGTGPQRLQVQKLVITTFVGQPDLPNLTHYIEICGPDTLSFEVASEGSLDLSDVAHFYRDTRACDAMYDQYILLDPATNRHHQHIGDDDLTVLPIPLSFSPVAPQNANASYCFSVLGQRNPVGGGGSDSLGCWLKVVQNRSKPWRRLASQEIRLDLLSSNLDIDNFYWFVILPDGYRSADAEFRQEDHPRKLQHAELEEHSVMEYSLPHDFAVYSEWAPIIYRRAILKNRRSLALKTDGRITMSFRAVDDSFASRIGSISFLNGVILALSTNAVISGVVYGLENGFSRYVQATLAGLIIACCATTWWGWRTLSAEHGSRSTGTIRR